MTVNSSVRSNASNFMSQLQTGVDPRTGQFTVSLKMPTIQSWDRRGPELQIALAYSAYNTVDAGFGRGWEVPHSQFRVSSGILTTDGGETFRVTSDPALPGRMTIGQQKLESFHFYRDSAAVYRLVHRSGEVEFMEERGSGQFRAAVPVQICTPQGHRLTLDYEDFGGHPRLARVRQSDGEILLEIKRESSALTLSLNPYAGEQPTARYVLHMDGEAKVTRVELPTDEKAAWNFGYRKIRELWCITEMRTPLGGLERLSYDDEGHKYPGNASKPALPRVTRHLRYPDNDSVPLDVRYTYHMDPAQPDQRNFLGYELTYSWSDDGLDYLYQHNGDYRYGTIESYWTPGADGVERPMRSIRRHFNRYHLQLMEQTSQGNAVARQSITYNLHDNTDFDNQPATCQLPISTTDSWWLADAPSTTRSETETRTYDSQGNLLTLTRPDGVQEVNQYYSAEGEDSEEGTCPAHPEGFITCLKKVQTIPAPGADAAPTLIKRFSYRSLAALQDPLHADLPDWYAPSTERSLELKGAQEVELTKKQYTYVNDVDEPFQHGRVAMTVTTRDFLPSVVVHQYTRIPAEDTADGVPLVQASELNSGWDGVESSNLVQESALTGAVVLRQDSEGVQVRYEHDALGRPLREILAPDDDDYRGETTWRYYLTGDASVERAGVSTTTLGGITTRTYLDGLGRVVLEERDQVNEEEPKRLHATQEMSYDSIGQLVGQVEHDWYQNKQHSLTTRFEYDDWGEQHRTIGPDGVVHHEELNPIGNREHSGPVIRSWRSSGGKISGMTESWMNLFKQPQHMRALDASGALLWARSYLYDGLGRLRTETDEYRQPHKFTYDALGRLTSTTLPDNTIIEHSYAADSEEELLAEVALLPGGSAQKRAVLGSQVFDSQGRLTQAMVGKQKRSYHYETGSNRVSRHTSAAGKDTHMSYLLNLTGDPVSSTSPDESSTYDYDPRTANLIKAKNADGERSYVYNASGQITRERWQDNAGAQWDTGYAHSMRGRLQSRTDPAQSDTLYTYDALGRVNGMTCEQVTVSYDYDNFARLSTITVMDGASSSEQVTRYGYDDQDRECSRTTVVTGQPERILRQGWYEGSRLKTRELIEGSETLLSETFSYDSRGRLSIHECTGSELPRDELGRPVSKEVFTYDAFDNIATVTTTIEQDIFRARYTAREDDPCQLAGITYVPARATGNPTFSYDEDGNLLQDEAGRRLVYNSQSRLLAVSDSADQPIVTYRYDATGALYASQLQGQPPSLLFFEGNQLSLAMGTDKRRVLYSGDQPLAQQTLGDPGQTLLLQTTASHSVIAEYHLGQLRKLSYGAYGVHHEPDALDESGTAPRKGLLRFNGELAETALGWYLLGRGYRVYNERIRRFHSPDSLTVLDGGELNPYAFVGNDPINFRDPSGHSSFSAHGRQRSPVEDVLPALAPKSNAALIWSFMGIAILGTLLSVASFGGAVAGVIGAATVTAAMIAKTTVLGIGAVTAVVSMGLNIYATVRNDEKMSMVAAVVGAVGALPSLLIGTHQVVRSSYKFIKNVFRKPPAAGWNSPYYVAKGQTVIPRARLGSIKPLSRSSVASTTSTSTNELASRGSASSSLNTFSQTSLENIPSTSAVTAAVQSSPAQTPGGLTASADIPKKWPTVGIPQRVTTTQGINWSAAQRSNERQAELAKQATSALHRGFAT